MDLLRVCLPRKRTMLAGHHNRCKKIISRYFVDILRCDCIRYCWGETTRWMREQKQLHLWIRINVNALPVRVNFLISFSLVHSDHLMDFRRILFGLLLTHRSRFLRWFLYFFLLLMASTLHANVQQGSKRNCLFCWTDGSKEMRELHLLLWFPRGSIFVRRTFVIASVLWQHSPIQRIRIFSFYLLIRWFLCVHEWRKDTC